jgi:flagellar biogenesis protein FliO
MITSLLLLLTAALPPVPTVTVADLGNEVTITLSGVGVADGRLATTKDRVELSLASALVPTSLDLNDRIVKRIEVLADPPRLSLITRYGPRTTARLARGAVLETIERGVRVRLSRNIEDPDVTKNGAARAGTPFAELALSWAAAPTSPAAPLIPSIAPSLAAEAQAQRLASSAAAPAASAAPAPAASAPATAAVSPAAARTSAPAEAEAEEISPPAADDTSPRAATPLTGTARTPGAPVARTPRVEDEALSRAITWATVLALVAAAAVLVRTAHKRRHTPDRGELTVVSSRALSPKVRVVLLAVGGRQLLLSVADKGAELLTELSPEETAPMPAEELSPAQRALARAAANFARAEPRALPDAPAPKAVAAQAASTPASSPAVSGLLALRARATGTDEVPRGAWSQRPATELRDGRGR